VTPEIDTLRARRAALDASVREVEKEMAAAAADIFLAHLQQGTWKVENMRLRPVDGKAEDAMVKVLSDALRLGYHDSFRIFDGKICIYGQVDDGDLTIPLYVNPRASVEEIEEDAKTIQVNVDLAPEFLRRLERELLDATFALKTANDKVILLNQAIEKLKAGVVEQP
jgi:uncharacterized protein YggU (UPF0235/DUF167 family)